uniref:Oxysterol-binding protein n=1 Tax=Mesocestoides corti TaxID=53468 RepID=A0A5K3EKR4_MESCO
GGLTKSCVPNRQLTSTIYGGSSKQVDQRSSRMAVQMVCPRFGYGRIIVLHARDAEERQRWLDALQEARDLHTDNYALLQHTSRLLDSAATVSEFDRRIIEADAYLQILIDQHQAIDQQLSHTEQLPSHSCESVKTRLQRLIELVKKTIVCLQFAKENPKTAMVNLFATAVADASNMRQFVASNASSASTSAMSIKLNSADNQLVGNAAPHTPTPSDSLVTARSASDITDPTAGSESLASSYNHHHHQPASHQLKLRDIPAFSYSSSEGEEEEDIFYDTREHVASVSPTVSNVSRCHSSQLSKSGSDETLSRAEYVVNGEGGGVSSLQPLCGVYPDVTDMEKNHFGSVVSVGSAVRDRVPTKYSKVFAYDSLYDDDDEKDLGSLQSEGSVITYLISQLRIGMDLTRITLPTFILEKRSTLEMYADFLAHPDLWIAIGDGETPQSRLIACLRWYLSAFHASRRTPVCKKPYNPILGEIFRCCYCLGPETDLPPLQEDQIPATYEEDQLSRYGPIPYAADDCVVFLAEQVSHHPPISAFYAEYIPKRIQVSGHIWTKSKFLGLSIGVEMVGNATIVLLDRPGEEYVVTFPSAYGRNILSVPWVELGGQCSVSCAKTGYYATVNFRTKPFYGGKKDQIRAEAFAPDSKKPFLVVEGEWNGQMIGRWTEDGSEELFVDTKVLPIMKKQVRPRPKQLLNESRRMWESVTQNLKQGNIDAATDAKSLLEQRQRREAAARLEAHQKWHPFYFTEVGGSAEPGVAPGKSVTYAYKWPLAARSCPPPASASVGGENTSSAFSSHEAADM